MSQAVVIDLQTYRKKRDALQRQALPPQSVKWPLMSWYRVFRGMAAYPAASVTNPAAHPPLRVISSDLNKL